MNMVIDLIGWLGAGCILLAYYLVSTKKVTASSKNYQLINLLGGISLVINAYAKGATPLVALNIVWIIIAVKSLVKNK